MTASGLSRGNQEPAPAVRVRAHPGLCVGWGECHRWAPRVYPLDDEGHVAVHMMEVPSEYADDAWWGASVCPEQAITVIGPPEDYWFARLRRRHGRADGTPSTPISSD
jgi:ferredoxin